MSKNLNGARLLTAHSVARCVLALMLGLLLNLTFIYAFAIESNADESSSAVTLSHVHSGSSESGGGCYGQAVTHVHEGNPFSRGGCYQDPIYHEHNEDCYADCELYLTYRIGNSQILACPNSNHGTFTNIGTLYVTVHHGDCGQGDNEITLNDVCYYCASANHDMSNYDDYAWNRLSGFGIERTHESRICGRTDRTVMGYALSCGKIEGGVDRYETDCGLEEREYGSLMLSNADSGWASASDGVTLQASLSDPDGVLTQNGYGSISFFDGEGNQIPSAGGSARVHANGRYSAKASVDGGLFNASAATVSIVVSNIDSDVPTILDVALDDGDEWLSSNEITVYAEDAQTDGNPGAGLADEAYSFDGGTTWQASPSFTVTESGTVEICVRDACGNVARTSVTITNVDVTGPSVEFDVPSGEWHEGDGPRTFVINASDGDVGLAEAPYSYDGGETWTSDNTVTRDEPGSFTVLVRDAFGNVTEIVIENEYSTNPPSGEDGDGSDDAGDGGSGSGGSGSGSSDSGSGESGSGGSDSGSGGSGSGGSDSGSGGSGSGGSDSGSGGSGSGSSGSGNSGSGSSDSGSGNSGSGSSDSGSSGSGGSGSGGSGSGSSDSGSGSSGSDSGSGSSGSDSGSGGMISPGDGGGNGSESGSGDSGTGSESGTESDTESGGESGDPGDGDSEPGSDEDGDATGPSDEDTGDDDKNSGDGDPGTGSGNKDKNKNKGGGSSSYSGGSSDDGVTNDGGSAGGDGSAGDGSGNGGSAGDEGSSSQTVPESLIPIYVISDPRGDDSLIVAKLNDEEIAQKPDLITLSKKKKKAESAAYSGTVHDDDSGTREWTDGDAQDDGWVEFGTGGAAYYPLWNNETGLTDTPAPEKGGASAEAAPSGGVTTAGSDRVEMPYATAKSGVIEEKAAGLSVPFYRTRAFKVSASVGGGTLAAAVPLLIFVMTYSGVIVYSYDSRKYRFMGIKMIRRSERGRYVRMSPEFMEKAHSSRYKFRLGSVYARLHKDELLHVNADNDWLTLPVQSVGYLTVRSR